MDALPLPSGAPQAGTASRGRTPLDHYPPSDVDLVQRARGGDRDAVRELLERHYQSLVEYALSRWVGPGDARDLVHDALVQFVGDLGRLRQDGQFLSWARQMIRDRVRALRAEEARACGLEHIAQALAAPRGGEKADEANLGGLLELLEAALTSLQERCKRVGREMLRYFDAWDKLPTSEQIAKEVGLGRRGALTFRRQVLRAWRRTCREAGLGPRREGSRKSRGRR